MSFFYPKYKNSGVSNFSPTPECVEPVFLIGCIASSFAKSNNYAELQVEVGNSLEMAT